jgi:hypothetical protein
MSVPKKRVAVIGFAVVFAAVVVIGLLLPNDWQRRKPRISNRLWVSGEPGAMLLHYVTEEERSKREIKVLRSRGPSDYIERTYSRYRLHTRSVETAEEIKQVRAADIFNAVNGQGPDILGSTTGTLWIWNTSLEARDPRTLQVKLTAAEIQKHNPKLGAILPKDKKYNKVSAPHSALIFKGADTEIYQLDSETGAIAVADQSRLETLSYNKTVEEGFNFVPIQGASTFHTSPNSFMTTAFTTETGEWFSLLTKDDRKKLDKWSGKGTRPWADVARSLYKTQYKMDSRGEVQIDPESVTPAGTELFVRGGFLIRTHTGSWEGGEVWQVPAPDSALVLCKKALGEQEPWHVARLALDGSVIWNQSTGLTDFGEIADGGTHAIFAGETAPASKAAYENQTIVFLDTKSGASRSFKISDSKLE